MTVAYRNQMMRDPLRHNRGLLETAEAGLRMAQEIFRPGGMTLNNLCNAGDRLEGLDVGVKRCGAYEPVSASIRGYALLGHALGRLLKALWKALPVEEIGRDQEWGLPEFLAPLYHAAEDLAQRFEAAVYEWRQELDAAPAFEEAA